MSEPIPDVSSDAASSSQSPKPSTTSPDSEHFEALLASVSHDLRSPLLTMSLSVELLQDGPAEQRERLVLDALREGVRDIERMLDAISALSRAHKRELEPSSSLGDLLMRTDAKDLGSYTLAADGRLVREFLDSVESAALEVAMTPEGIELAAPVPELVPDLAPELRGSPLAGLLDSLKAYAGTPVEGLAAIELQAQRQGGSLAVSDRRARLRLPLADASSANGRTP